MTRNDTKQDQRTIPVAVEVLAGIGGISNPGPVELGMVRWVGLQIDTIKCTHQAGGMLPVTLVSLQKDYEGTR